MNAQTHKAIPTFRLGHHYHTEAQANVLATQYSLMYPDQFIYVILSTTSGKYRHDYIGLQLSDERIISAYKNGSKSL